MHAQKAHNLVGPTWEPNRRKPSSDLRIHSTIVLCFATPDTTRLARRANLHGSEVTWWHADNLICTLVCHGNYGNHDRLLGFFAFRLNPELVERDDITVQLRWADCDAQSHIDHDHIQNLAGNITLICLSEEPLLIRAVAPRTVGPARGGVRCSGSSARYLDV